MSTVKELKEKINELTANYEKRIYDLEQLLDISRSLCSTLEISKLFDSITFTCMAQLHVVNAGVFMLDSLSSEKFLLETKQSIIDPTSDIQYEFEISDPIVKLLSAEKRPLTPDYISENCPESHALKLLKNLSATMVIPLIQKNHINGLLFLGERLVFDEDADYTESEKKQIMEIGDLAALAISNATLLERSSTDMMTKLKLKYFFFNILTDKLYEAMEHKNALSVLMFDIDFFKHFNDTYGHECGDYVLKEVASMIKSGLREYDLASRYGGEEFTVLLDNTDREEAVQVANRIRKNIEEHEFNFDGQTMKVTISGGVAVFNHEDNPVQDPKDLVNQADQGLYMSKRNGRNQITYADPSVNINSVIILVLINVVFFFTLDNFFVYVRLPDSPVQYRMSVSYIMALNKNFCIDMKFFWQPFTYMFVHGDLNHLLSNMIGLLLFGFSVEKAIGSKEFVLFYLLSGFLSGLFSLFVYELTGNDATLLGASGALFAVMLAFAVIYPKAVIFLFWIIPVPAPIMVLLYAVVELFFQFTGASSNVAHLTHLFGFASAWLYFVVRMGINPIRVWKNSYKR